MAGGQNAPMRALFAKVERVKLPAQIKGTLYERLENREVGATHAAPKSGYSVIPHPVGRIGNYELSKISGRPVNLLQTRCADRDGMCFADSNLMAVVASTSSSEKTATTSLMRFWFCDEPRLQSRR